MKCPHCGYDLETPVKIQKKISLHDCKRAKDSSQWIENVTEINPPHKSKMYKYTPRGQVSRIKVYHVLGDE